MSTHLKIGFIGGGNMAAALIGGVADRLASGSDIHVVDPFPQALNSLKSRFGVSASTEMDAALSQCDVLVLAVKPQIMAEVSTALAPHVRNQLILSVAAGIRTADMRRWLSGYDTIIRTMPNTPSLIGQGVTGLFATDGVSPEHRELAQSIMRTTGQTLWVSEENMLDAVTAISGSGPAYVFYFIEALAEAGRMLGLDDGQAMQLALATFRGSSELASKSDEPVSALRANVTSPEGTTFAAISLMEKSKVRDQIIDAVRAAFTRSIELGDSYGNNPGS